MVPGGAAAAAGGGAAARRGRRRAAGQHRQLGRAETAHSQAPPPPGLLQPPSIPGNTQASYLRPELSNTSHSVHGCLRMKMCGMTAWLGLAVPGAGRVPLHRPPPGAPAVALLALPPLPAPPHRLAGQRGHHALARHPQIPGHQTKVRLSVPNRSWNIAVCSPATCGPALRRLTGLPAIAIITFLALAVNIPKLFVFTTQASSTNTELVFLFYLRSYNLPTSTFSLILM